MNRKTFIKKIKNRIRCGRKRKKEIISDIEELFDEKISLGMCVDEIIEEMGTADEISEEINVYLNERGLCFSDKVARIRSFCKGVSIITGVLSILMLLHILIVQNKILLFINEHKNADSIFMAAPQNVDIFWVGLLILFIAYLLSKITLWKTEQKIC